MRDQIGINQQQQFSDHRSTSLRERIGYSGRSRSPRKFTTFRSKNQDFRDRSESPDRRYTDRYNYRDRYSGNSSMSSHIKESSQQDRRVYVGNLAYEIKWPQLKDFMRQAGEVIFADVLLLPNGKSKGCGIVEYATREDAQRAVNTLSNQSLMGRLVFVREDRESEPKFSSGTSTSAGGYSSSRRQGPPPSNAAPGTQLFVGNLPYSTSWQDLKDLFRGAGNIVRSDILIGHDGRSKGSGLVVFDSAESAQNAISKFNGYDYHGRPLEVREDRYVKGSSEDKNSELTKGATANGSPSAKIYVDNLPWATTNEDLVELFQTVAPVVRAEIKYLGNGRPQGSGVVEFSDASHADTSIAKFNGYNYGNRDLVLSYVNYL